MTDFVIVSVPNLTRDDARVRAELVRVESYDLVLDLTDRGGAPSDRSFRSTTVITFAATRQGASTFVDIVADAVHRVTLNGKEAKGAPLPRERDGYEHTTCFLALNESWTRVRQAGS